MGPIRRVTSACCALLVVAMGFASAPAAAAPGDIVSAGPGTFSMDPVLRLPMPGVRATHVVYRSTNVRGDPNVVSGTILVPTTPYLGKRPIVGYAVGTHGLGDGCAPSRQMADGVETETAQVMLAIAKGWAVALTDYEGLGTPGQHTYVVGPSLGHAVLDAIRAASRVPGLGLAADAPTLIWGYSEGGAAATWAAQLQPTYAPELRLLGTAAGGVPADVAAVARHLDGGAFFGFGVSALLGLDAAFPQLDLEQYLNAAGRDLFTTHADDCLVSLLLPPFTLNRYASITTQDVLARSDVQSAFAVSKLGATAPRAPILLYHGLLDEVIPYDVGKRLRDRYCALGAKVEWQTYAIAEHVVGSVVTAPSALAWLSERVGGWPVPDDCGTAHIATSSKVRRSLVARRSDAKAKALRVRRTH